MRFRAFERDVAADRVQSGDPGGIEQWANLKSSCLRIGRKILQVGNAQKKFDQAATEIRLRFLIRGRLS